MPEDLYPEWQADDLIALRHTGNGEVAIRLTFGELEALHRWAQERPLEGDPPAENGSPGEHSHDLARNRIIDLERAVGRAMGMLITGSGPLCARTYQILSDALGFEGIVPRCGLYSLPESHPFPGESKEADD